MSNFSIKDFIKDIGHKYQNRDTNGDEIIQGGEGDEVGNILRNIWEKIECRNGKPIKEILNQIINNPSTIPSFSNNKINFYPSETLGGGCQSICVGFATKGFNSDRDKKKRTGFKGLMQDIIIYWLNCGKCSANSRLCNRTTILFVTEWNSSSFKNSWEKIIDGYCTYSTTNISHMVFVIEISPNGDFFTHYPNN